MRITVDQAVVRTAAVEIKTLTISGKQVTLAVFRQLQEEPLLDPRTCQLAGVPWGRINYHPDKCQDQSKHIHIVWQKGSELRRSKVEKARHQAEAIDVRAEDATRRTYLLLVALTRLKNGNQSYKIEKDHSILSRAGTSAERIAFDDGLSVSINFYSEQDTFCIPNNRPGFSYAVYDSTKWINSIKANCPSLVEETSEASTDTESLERFYLSRANESANEIAALKSEAARRDAEWAGQYEALMALDQLFIAV